MSRKLPIVTVIGSGGTLNTLLTTQAHNVGEMLARLGVNILTGGGQGVVLEASKAYVESPERYGNVIGVVPGSLGEDYGVKAGYPNDFVEMPIFTHLPGSDPRGQDSRNYINILSGDIILALSGGAGTEAELDLALKNKKPVLVFLENDQRIGAYKKENLSKHEGVIFFDNKELLENKLQIMLSAWAQPRPSFALLKSNYKLHGTHNCTMEFPNTCAIRLSEALAKTDRKFMEYFTDSTVNKCPHKYIRGAQDLASILRQASVFGVHDLGWEAPGSVPSGIKGKKGIVCYMNIPTYPDGQGHIDLWENEGPVGDAYWDGNPIWFWSLPD